MSDVVSNNAAPVDSSVPDSQDGVSQAPRTAGTPIGRGTPAKTSESSTDSKVAKETAAKEAEAEARRKYKLKVDGREEEWEGTDEDVAKELQMSRAARKRMQEAAETKKRTLELLDAIKKDPFSALSDPEIGVDVMAMAKQRLIEQYEAERLKNEDPKEYEKKELERKLQEREAKLKEYEEAKQREAEAIQQRELKMKVESDFIAAMEATGLPKSPALLKELADVARANYEQQLDLTPEELAREAVERLNSHAQRFISSLKGEALIKQLGPDVVKEVLRHQLEQARAKKAPPAETPKPVLGTAKEVDDGAPRLTKRMSESDFHKLWR